ncbi:MAG: thiamine phosphate synthase [Pyrinomonadaceae bacterium]|nr:thiamine phosphate synthase [Pyrinomonadaceae bacterium]
MLKLPQPLTYLITSGTTTSHSQPQSEKWQRLLRLVRVAVESRITLVQLREKNLSPRSLYRLTAEALTITRGTETRLLVNDRADIARACGADGVHLTTGSLEASVVRRAFGDDFLIGVSAHTLLEAMAARDGGANFATFSPIFVTPSKRSYGAPIGIEQLNEAAHALAPFPLVALGGITTESAPQAIKAGARGIAAIRLFNDAEQLPETLRFFRHNLILKNE